MAIGFHAVNDSVGNVSRELGGMLDWMLSVLTRPRNVWGYGRGASRVSRRPRGGVERR